MAQITVQAGNILGLTPAVDAVNSDKTFALSGKNYVFDSLGPKSAFGSRIVLANPFWSATIRRGFQVIRASGRIMLCTNEALFQLDPTTDQLIPRILFEPFQQVHRWTHGFLNGVDYFCHPGVGVLYWDQRNNARGLNTTPGIPSSPVSIVVDNGRLAVMDNKTITWSGPSDGFDFQPKFAGAGSQVIGDRVSGTPILATSYSRGILVWTTQGIMRSEFVGGQEVYRHRGINTEFSPVNSFCVSQLDDNTTVILDRRGLLSSQGEPPVPYNPEFNEYLIEELKENDSLLNNNLRMEWDPYSRRLYISRSFNPTGEIYHQSFVLYAPLGKWGSFDSEHYGIGLGYWLDADGILRQIFGRGYVDGLTTDTTVHLYEKRRDYPQLIQRQRESLVLGSTIRATHLAESGNYILGRPIHYTYNASAPKAFQKLGLDSKIVVGLFRLLNQEYADQLTDVITVLIGSSLSREVSTSDVDYTTVPDGVADEDYVAATGGEDFGLDPVSFINFSLRDIGSNDGHTVFQSRVMTLAKFQPAMRVFCGGIKGLWHSLELSATQPGEFYHLKQLQLNGAPGGRLL